MFTGYDDSVTSSVTDDGEWKARWFPYGPGEVDTNPVIKHIQEHVNMMQEPDPSCDNGKVCLHYPLD